MRWRCWRHGDSSSPRSARSSSLVGADMTEQERARSCRRCASMPPAWSSSRCCCSCRLLLRRPGAVPALRDGAAAARGGRPHHAVREPGASGAAHRRGRDPAARRELQRVRRRARSAAEGRRAPRARRQRAPRAGEEPARRADVGARAERGRVQRRGAHPALQRAREAAAAEVARRRGRDRARGRASSDSAARSSPSSTATSSSTRSRASASACARERRGRSRASSPPRRRGSSCACRWRRSSARGPERPMRTDASGPGGVTGFVLVLDDITRRIESGNRRDLLLQTLTQGTRASLGSVRAAVETIAAFPGRRTRSANRFIGVIGDEARQLTARLDATVGEFADSLRTEWPLEDMRGADLIAAARRRIETKLGLPTKLETIDETIWLNVDSYSLMQAITYLASRLADEFGIRELRFGLAAAGALAHLDLIWTGAPLGTETTMAWQTDAMELGGEASPLTLKQIVERHNGEIWYQIHKPSHREFFRIAHPASESGGVGLERAARRRQPARVLRFRPLPSAGPDAGAGRPAARVAVLHGLRYRDDRARAVRGRRNRVDRRRADRQRPAARERGLRAARRPAARRCRRRRAASRGSRRRCSRTSRRSKRCCRRSASSARTPCWSRTTRRSTCVSCGSRRRRPASASRSPSSTRCSCRP